MPIEIPITSKEIHERQMAEFRKSLDEARNIGITARNFKDMKNVFWNILGKSDMVLMDLESSVMEREKKMQDLVNKAELRGLPSEGNDYFYALIEAITMLEMLKRDLDWRNFEFEIIEDWNKKLTQRVTESNDIEVDNIKLTAKIELAKEEHALKEQEIGKIKQDYEHKIEMQKLEDERKLREKELDIRKIELDKGIIMPPLLQPPTPPTPSRVLPDNGSEIPSAPRPKKVEKKTLDKSPDVRSVMKVLRPKLKIDEPLVTTFIERAIHKTELIPERWPNKRALTQSDFTHLAVGPTKFKDLNTDEQTIIRTRLEMFFADLLKSKGATPKESREAADMVAGGDDLEEEEEEVEDEDDSEEEEE